jgi:hypothetical protein
VPLNPPNPGELVSVVQSNHDSSLDLDYPIVPARLDDLTIATRRPKHSAYDSLVELESVGGDERGDLEIHPVRNVSKQVQCVAITAFAHHGRRPKPGAHVDHGEDPHRLLLAPDDRSDLVCLKFSFFDR